MWEAKYALTLPKNLGVGVDFRPHRASVVCDSDKTEVTMTKNPSIFTET